MEGKLINYYFSETHSFVIDSIWNLKDFNINGRGDLMSILFPLEDELSSEDIESMKGSEAVKGKLLKSFHFILRFYGFFVHEGSTAITRYAFRNRDGGAGGGVTEKPMVWMKNYGNYYAISRVLKCLLLFEMGELAGNFFSVICKYVFRPEKKTAINTIIFVREWMDCFPFLTNRGIVGSYNPYNMTFNQPEVVVRERSHLSFEEEVALRGVIKKTFLNVTPDTPQEIKDVVKRHTHCVGDGNLIVMLKIGLNIYGTILVSPAGGEEGTQKLYYYPSFPPSTPSQAREEAENGLFSTTVERSGSGKQPISILDMRRQEIIDVVGLPGKISTKRTSV